MKTYYTVQIEILPPRGERDWWADVFRVAHRAQAEDLARDLAAVVGASRVRLQVIEDRGVIVLPAPVAWSVAPVDDCRCGHGRRMHARHLQGVRWERWECLRCECLNYERAGT